MCLFRQQRFNDPQLTPLITQALAHNTDVQSALAALRKADVVRLEYGGRWILNPAVTFKGGHNRRMNVLIRYQAMEQQELPLELLEAERKVA